jgi:glycosyltransferase involved in cell wall biosynthesis
MWKNKRVSVVFSTYNENKSVEKCINGLFETGYVDEVVAVDNNAVSGTKEEILKTKAKYFFEPKQGFGFGYRRALSESDGDIIIMIEPDGTFDPEDVIKFLAYSDNFDVVFGTRTTSIMIGEGANMGLFLKWGNYFVAKFTEFLFNTSHLSDIGCTYRLINRNAYIKIKDKFSIGGNEFNPDMMLQIIRNKIKYIEIPVKYLRRVGTSSVTGRFSKVVCVGLRMILLILRHRFNFVKK